MPIKELQKELQKPLPGLAIQMLMAPPVRTASMQIPSNVRKGGVCILLYKKNNCLHTILIKRTEDGGTHSGQTSLPGGKYDATDYSITYTALRELEEEIGVPKNDIQILGNLTELYIPPSNFLVSPIVAFIQNDFEIKISEAEVKEIIELKLDDLLIETNKIIHTVKRSDDATKDMQTPIYKINENIIWGATAMILRELEEVWTNLLNEKLRHSI